MKGLIGVAALGLLAACGGGAQKAVDNGVVAAAVKAKLVGIDADALTTVTATAANGVVTLSGQARTPSERAKYLAAARSVNGVTSVVDRLRVNPDLRGLRERSADIALDARVSAAIAGQAGVNILHLKVSSRGGVVALAGHVPSHSIERTVVETARAVRGVKRVVSQISVQR